MTTGFGSRNRLSPHRPVANTRRTSIERRSAAARYSRAAAFAPGELSEPGAVESRRVAHHDEAVCRYYRLSGRIDEDVRVSQGLRGIRRGDSRKERRRG